MESNTDTKDQISGSIFGLYVYMSVLQCYTISYLFFFSDNFSFSVYSFGYSNFKGNENVIMDPYFHFDLLFFAVQSTVPGTTMIWTATTELASKENRNMSRCMENE